MTKTRGDLIRAWCEKGRRDYITAQHSLLDTKEIFSEMSHGLGGWSELRSLGG